MSKMHCGKIGFWHYGCFAAVLTLVTLVTAAEPIRILRPAKTSVDSHNYEYYDGDVLCDGVRTPTRWTETWLSTDWKPLPHWAELTFTSAVPVRTVAVFWGVENNGTPASSRNYAIQAWKDGAFVDVLEVKDNLPTARSVHVLADPVVSTRFRIWQPVEGGGVARPNGLWLAEIELYTEAKSEAEFDTAADQAELQRNQEVVRDNTIGIFRRSRYFRGRPGSVVAPMRSTGMRVIPLDYLDARELGLCRIAVLAGARCLPDPDAVEAYVRDGGGLIAIYDSCGRGGGSAIPDVWSFVGMADDGGFTLSDTRHPITKEITNEIATTYGDYAVLKAGRNGAVLARDAKGRDVVVAGPHGTGRAVAIGTFPGMSSGTNWNAVTTVVPAAGELALLTNAVGWLTQETAGQAPRRSWFSGRKEKPAKKRLFEDMTDACGMYYWGYSKNVAFADVDGDGFQDIFSTQSKTSSIDPGYNLLYRNHGNWKFTEIGHQAGVSVPHGIGSAFGDLNNDGHLDLFVAWMPEMAGKNEVGALFLGDGAFNFLNVTEEAGLGGLGQVSVCQLVDFDNDGNLDIYVAGCGQENRLYRNHGNGKFEDVTTSMGLDGLGAKGESGYGGNMACALGDLDGDGYPDLVAFNKNVLHVFRNNGGKGFQEVPDYLGAGKPPLSGGTLGLALGDYDNDGDLDVYVAFCNKLLRNDGNFQFIDVATQAGLDVMEKGIGPYGTTFADWNNDGHLDLFVASGGFDNTTFQNNGDGTFTDVSCAIGLDAFAVHGFGFADLDNDGDLDYFSTAWSKFPCVLLRNNLDDGNALTIYVKGRQTNRSGIGAKIWVYEEGKLGEARHLRGYREVRSGGGSMYSGAILQQHIGVTREKTYTVEVLFPVSGKRVVLSDVTAPQILTIEEEDMSEIVTDVAND